MAIREYGVQLRVLFTILTLVGSTGCGGEATPVEVVGPSAESGSVPSTMANAEVGDSVTLTGGGLTVTIELPQGLEPDPTLRRERVSDDPNVLVHERWRGDGYFIAMSVQTDPGDDANLFQLDVTSTFESSLGTWGVIDIGAGDGMHRLLMVRVDGYVAQITGTAAPLEVLEGVASSLRLEPSR